jgi:NADH:ubiquinone oxidoreductase subunit F (NADH-binding)
MATVLTPLTTSRLIERGEDLTGSFLEAHIRRHGPHLLLDRSDYLLAEIERSGLTGRGGAGFPASTKLQLARSSGRGSVLVANAMEGEPASKKDRFLFMRSPHLVLDGAELVAAAIRATRIIICVPNDPGDLARMVTSALSERAAVRYPRCRIEVRELAGRYIAGEESALVANVSGGSGLPRFRPDKSVPMTIGREPAVVQNIETLAHVALIARYGAEWFREVGSSEAPGTCLVTVSGAVERPGVVEIATGTPIEAILKPARPMNSVQSVLVGGYGGVWLSRLALATPYAPKALRALGASMGVGVLVVLGSGSCGIRETERIAQFMASESAGQCGPCLFGLPAIAKDLRTIADGEAEHQVLERLTSRCETVTGRGACRHPDGVARLVRSALEVFASDVASHVRGVPCAVSGRPSILASRPGLAKRR